MGTDRQPKRRTRLPDHSLFVECVRRAALEREPKQKAELLLDYLETFPLGAHNREVAEQLELLFDVLGAAAATHALLDRYRSARERYLPPLVARS